MKSKKTFKRLMPELLFLCVFLLGGLVTYGFSFTAWTVFAVILCVGVTAAIAVAGLYGILFLASLLILGPRKTWEWLNPVSVVRCIFARDQNKTERR